MSDKGLKIEYKKDFWFGFFRYKKLFFILIIKEVVYFKELNILFLFLIIFVFYIRYFFSFILIFLLEIEMVTGDWGWGGRIFIL